MSENLSPEEYHKILHQFLSTTPNHSLELKPSQKILNWDELDEEKRKKVFQALHQHTNN